MFGGAEKAPERVERKVDPGFIFGQFCLMIFAIVLLILQDKSYKFKNRNVYHFIFLIQNFNCYHNMPGVSTKA